MTRWEWGGQRRSRALGGRAGGQSVHLSVSWPRGALCRSDSASWNPWSQGSKTRQFPFNVYCHFWIALSGLPKKKLCSTISLINLLPTSLRKTRPANSLPAADCCALSRPASCWQPRIYIGNQIRRYLSWDMHKEYSPMSNLISM